VSGDAIGSVSSSFRIASNATKSYW
jgi:hypothetical protein